ncbi:Mu transposase C-terminal domain-containing protein [Actinoplanes sp. M2I2]|uniref:Mu transposase C-terminal domain-containing protein n=1 Tax=Actinoplanes sp. M2I2 TaxID=1734444 RepID=UPI002020FE48|nr:Mu transposase C-terminal domain-containing protein [Actinoplanes sp. M2I2]
MRQVLHLGDQVRYEDREYRVVALTGTHLRLAGADDTTIAVLLTHLLTSDGFALLNAAPVPAVINPHLDDLDTPTADLARQWEQHIIEMETGLPLGAGPHAQPRPEYDPATTTLTERCHAKARELTALGWQASPRTIDRMRRRLRTTGDPRALTDGRARRPVSMTGDTDPRVVEVIRQALQAEVPDSTGTRDRFRWRVQQIITDRYPDDPPPVPAKSTFNKLLRTMTTGTYTFDAAVTRRNMDNRPAGGFTTLTFPRPGQVVQIDTTTIDVLTHLGDGVAERGELTAAVDVATRTLCAGILRPQGTKAIDAALLLPRMLVPDPMRPGWDDALRITHSCLPYERLIGIDDRMRLAAAKPAIYPETIVYDQGKVYVSATFVQACRRLGISLQPAPPGTPTYKGVIERTFGSINTLFCQYVVGYVGRDTTRRGARIADKPLWSLAQLQDLFDEWVIASWQSRPHDELASPDTGRRLSPNEMYATLVEAAGYVPVMLRGDDYLELLPTFWATINDYGVRWSGRIYTTRGLPRRQPSGVTAQKNKWQVAYDEYDITRIWVRNHHGTGWFTLDWTHRAMVNAPLADFTWRHARRKAATMDSTEPLETRTARVLNDLLRRAGQGPPDQPPSPGTALTPDERRVVGRTRAGAAAHRPTLDDPPSDGIADEHDDASVEEPPGAPFGTFDAADHAQRWLP